MSLKISSLTKKFDNKTVLKDFSYIFPLNGIFAVTGKSGVGKTTLLRLICGLDNVFEGEISGSIDNCSVVFQEYRLFPALSALENSLVGIAKPSHANYEKAIAIFKKLGFTDAEINMKPETLSGGMKQRVSLVRAFMMDSPIYLLDEPTKELDAALVRTVLDLIKEISKVHLVILVSHLQSDIEYLNAKIINLELLGTSN